MEPKRRRCTGGGSGVTSARITWAKANMPTNAGMTSTPPSRSSTPKVKRGVPDGFSMPMQATSSPSSIEAMALTGEDRATNLAAYRDPSLPVVPLAVEAVAGFVKTGER